MKVLSLLQPWASLCVHTDENGKAFKQIETRSWNTKYRGELLIHASKKKIKLQDGMYELIDQMERIGFMKDYEKLPYGAIIGKVNLVDVTTTSIINSNTDLDINTNWKHLTKQELAFGDYSEGRFGWLLSDPVLFKNPIPCKGQLSIWNLPKELENIVRSQVGRSISHEKAIEVYRRNVWPRDEHGNQIEISEEERLKRINTFRSQGYF